MKINYSKIKFHIPILLFLLFYFLIISYKLISHPTPFYDWDESIYVEVGREMAQKNSLIPLWQGAAWLEKPPLVPLIYGLIIQYVPIQPEISTRIFSLMLAVAAFVIVYRWVFKTVETLRPTSSRLRGASRDVSTDIAGLFSTLVVVIIAFNPLFLQKAQTVNTDVWLLIGILGYLLTYPRFWSSFLFLCIGMMSKSLLGFYPALMIAGFEIYKYFVDKKRKRTELYRRLKNIGIQIAMLALWYVIMLLLYKSEFITIHFRDHLLRRVTQSVESKFGKRTYYFDLIVEQFGMVSVLTVISIGILLYKWRRRYIDDENLFKSLFLLPYFLFLNLTKTKIPWYIIPAVPQAAFLIAYPITLLQKVKPLFIVICLGMIGFVVYKGVYADKLFTSYYSQYDDYYHMSLYAKEKCDKLYVLPDGGSRNTHDTLEKLGLLLSTTEIYGNHPAVVYYFGKETEFIYSLDTAKKRMNISRRQECFAIEKNDTEELLLNSRSKKSKQFNSVYLYY